MFVYSTGTGVHGFTLDPSLGEFLLSHESLALPDDMKVYSVNESNAGLWPPGVRAWLDDLKTRSGTARTCTARYIGSLVADFHRNLLCGGIFAYPADSNSPQGKLRLLYEASPLAFLIEQVGGAASDGTRRILDIEPTDLHQRTPLFIGNRAEVERVAEFLARTER